MARPNRTVTPAVTITDTRDPLVTLAVAAALVTVVLTATTMWLSYEHLHDVAAAHGLGHSVARSWAWPATVDLFIVLGEVLILRASLARRGTPLAVALTVGGALGSIALNVAGVGGHASPMDYTVAAVPPIASLLAFGALMWQLHGWIGSRMTGATAPAVTPPTGPTSIAVTRPAEVAPPRPTLPPAPAPTGPRMRTIGHPTAAPTPPVSAPSAEPWQEPIPDGLDPSARVIATLYRALRREPVTSEMIAALASHGLKHGDGTARTARLRAREGDPSLARYPQRQQQLTAV
ncbi:DUF2637 domain-containing protein [Embleya sp. NPDC020630]|uniref:DUF2637 domain-containing protein n=1 Tax=Embleya sp. NPDC020630 TaxID=3363979 RepID=UPI00378D6EE7